VVVASWLARCRIVKTFFLVVVVVDLVHTCTMSLREFYVRY